MKILIMIMVIISSFIITLNAQSLKWQSINDGLGGGIASSLVCTSDGTLYAGSSGKGVLFTSNKGASWNTLSGDKNYYNYIDQLVIDESDNIYCVTALGITRKLKSENQLYTLIERQKLGIQPLYLAISKDSKFMYCSGFSKTIKSSNGGNNWDVISSVGTGKIYAHGNTEVLIFDGSLKYSSDNGNSWAVISTPDQDKEGFADLYYDSDGKIYLATRNNIYYKMAISQAWLNISQTIKDPYFTFIEKINNSLFAGTMKNGLFKSTDMGQNWEQMKSGNLSKYLYCITMDKSNALYLSSSNGIMVSDDEGLTWSSVASFSTPFVNVITSTTKKQTFCLNNGNMYSWGSKTRVWSYVNLPDGVVPYSINTDSKGNIIVPSSIGIYKSDDNGDTWMSLNNLFNSQDIKTLLIDYSDHIFLTSSQGIYKSTDGGLTFEPCNTGIVNPTFATLLASRKGKIYALKGDSLYRSSNLGTEWEFMSDVNPLEHSNQWISGIYITYSGELILKLSFMGDQRLKTSPDDGKTWIDWDLKINNQYNDINSFINPEPDTYIVGTNGFVFVSFDARNTWDLLSVGNYMISVSMDLNGNIFAGSAGQGVFLTRRNPVINIADELNVNMDEKTEVQFTIGNVNSENLSVTARSYNEYLIPNDSIKITGSGNNWTLSFTPVTGESGTCAIYIEIDDGDNKFNKLVIVKVKAPNSIAEARLSNELIRYENSQLIINPVGLDNITGLVIYDIAGRQIQSSYNIPGSDEGLIFLQVKLLNHGFYFIEMVCRNKRIISKVLINE